MLYQNILFILIYNGVSRKLGNLTKAIFTNIHMIEKKANKFHPGLSSGDFSKIFLNHFTTFKTRDLNMVLNWNNSLHLKRFITTNIILALSAQLLYT